MSRSTACVPEDRILRVLKEDDSALCTGCGSMDIVRFGRTAKGTQRYRCSACGRTFVQDGPKAGTKLDDGVWEAYARCHAGGLSAREASRICGVSEKTIYRMRRRVCEAVRTA